MLEFLQSFLFSQHYMPQGYLYPGQPELLWLYVVSDVLIALAYYSIPLLLVYFIRQRDDVPFRRVFVLFSAFILTCGTTHILEVVTLWQPIYWISGGVKALTALVSCYTAVALVPIIPKALALPSPKVLASINKRLETEIEDRKLAETRVQQLNAELEQRIEARTADLQEAYQKLEQEVVERQQVEQELEQFFSLSLDMLCIADTEGHFRRVNPAFSSTLGYPPAELVMQPFLHFVHPDDYQATQATVKHLKHGDVIMEFENRYRCADGTYRWLTWNASPDRDGKVYAVARDTTDQKHSKALLKSSEQRWRSLFEAAPDSVLILDTQGIIQQINPKVLQKSGYLEIELLNHPFETFLATADQQTWPQFFAHLLEAGTQRKEVAWLTAEGEVRNMDCSCRVIQSPDPYVLVLQRDISDRKLLETRLRSSEQQMRAVFDAMNDVVLMCELESGEITDVEIAPTDPTIYEDLENDCISQTVQYLWYNAGNDWGEQIQQVLATGQTVEFEYSLEMGNSERWFTASVSQLSERSVLWVARDISDRKQAEDALRQSEARYRAIYDNTPVMLHSIDNQGKLISVSNYWLEKMGYQRHEVLGRLSTEFLTPDSQQDANGTYLPQLYAQGFVQNAAFQFVTKSGIVMDILLSAITERNTQGAVERSLAVIIDVTELKRVEQQLQKTNAELTRSNRELEQFAYVASHDLKEPLRMVTSFTQLLAQNYEGQLDANADQMIAFAVDGATRMQRLIDDLLAYSRVGTQRNALTSMDCNLVVEAAKANLQMAIAESQAVINQQSLPTLLCDRVQLQQLWQNLLGNAIKYRSKDPLQIDIGVEEQKHQWLFSVRDNGIGMNPAHAERIFMIFQRLHTKQEYPGTGIGLAICSKIVEQLGGKIWVESELGSGSTFYFTLPKSSVS